MITHYWASGQTDNIGDVYLRREPLRAMQEAGPCNVYTGRASKEYVDGLQLYDRDRSIDSFLVFLVRAALSTRSKRCRFVFDPGEVNLNWRVALMYYMALPVVVLYALQGRNRVVMSGLGIGSAQPPLVMLLPVVLNSKLARRPTWRDARTHSLVGVGVEKPDWGFAADGSEHNFGERADIAAVTARYDGTASDTEIARLINAWCVSNQVTPVVVVQVRRDSARMRRLAGALGCDFIDWPASVPLVAHEAEVHELYRKAKFVVSDRMHALIMGLRDGAMPILLDVGTVRRSKIEHCFRTANVPLHALSDSPTANDVTEVIEAGQRAKDDLDDLASSLFDAQAIGVGHV